MSEQEIETWAGPFHKAVIPKGEYGQISKIAEEVAEALDAVAQNQTLMLLVECADILGAVVGCLADNASEEHQWYQSFEDVYPRFADQSDEEKCKNMERVIDSAVHWNMGFTAEDGESIVANVLSIAINYNLDFQQLKAFAMLRSQVARYAVGKAQGKSEEELVLEIQCLTKDEQDLPEQDEYIAEDSQWSGPTKATSIPLDENGQPFVVAQLAYEVYLAAQGTHVELIDRCAELLAAIVTTLSEDENEQYELYNRFERCKQIAIEESQLSEFSRSLLKLAWSEPAPKEASSALALVRCLLSVVSVDGYDSEELRNLAEAC